MNVRHDSPISKELTHINDALASILHAQPVELSFGAETSLADDLVVCGILGGKNVGKSTLINALARDDVSVDPEGASEGTDRPVLFYHADMKYEVLARLHAVERVTPMIFQEHRAEAVRNVVLMDLPDFDSEFLDHLRIVQAVVPLLDRVLWVLTPRKIGDRAWVELLPRVIKDARNVHCVLNKIDELLTDAEPFDGGQGRSAKSFWEAHEQWMTEAMTAAGFPPSGEHRFMIAAGYPQADAFVKNVAELWDDPAWSRYADDRPIVEEIARRAESETNRLRQTVLGPVTVESAQQLKQANRDREAAVHVARITDHFQLDGVLQRLANACDPDYVWQILHESLGAEYSRDVARSLEMHMRSESELADGVLERRIHRWPLLRLVYWPFGWLSRVLGRRAAASPKRVDTAPADATDQAGQPLIDRVSTFRSRLLADHSPILRQLDLEREIPDERTLARSARSAIGRLATRLDQHMMEDVAARDRKPGFFRKSLLWLVFLWFPILQPMFDGALEIVLLDSGLSVLQAIHKIVRMLSAPALLLGFSMSLLVCVTLLAAMYVRALRDVRRARLADADESPAVEAVEEALVETLLVPVMGPLEAKLTRLTELRERLKRVA